MTGRRVLIPILVLLAMVAGAVSLLAGPGASAQTGDGDDAQAQADQAAPEQAANEPPQATLELTIWQGVDRPLDFWISSRADDEAAWTQAELEMALQEGGGWRVGDLTVTAGEHDFDLRLWHDPAETDEDTDEVWLSARLTGELWSDYGTQQVELDQVSESGDWNYANVSLALPLRSPTEPNEDPDAVAFAVCPPEDQTKTYAYVYIWQRKTALDSFWITSRTASNQKWQTVKLSLTLPETVAADEADNEDAGATEDADGTEDASADEAEEQTWNTADLTIAGRRGALDLRLWQDTDDQRNVWLSARSGGAGWDDYGTKQWSLDRTSKSGRYWYRLQTVTVAVPDNEAAEPGSSTPNWESWDCNNAPTANAGEDQTVNAGSTVTLDGSESSDPDGDALTYAWTGPEDIELTDADTDTATFTATTEQVGDTLTFTLTVTDPGGKSGADDVEITVQQPAPVFFGGGGGGGGGGGAPTPSPGQQDPNSAPTAEAGDDQTVAPGATVTLDGSGSSDSDGTITSYTWSMTSDGTYDGGDTISIGSMQSPSFLMPDNATAGETLIIRLTVTDDDNATGTDTVTITATDLLNAGADADVQRGATASLSGTYNDPNTSTTPNYLWTKTGGTYTGSVSINNSTSLTGASLTMPLAAKTNQTIILTLTVTDGNATVTDTVTITAKNTAPVASASANVTEATRGSRVDLTGSATDANVGETLTYSWAETGTDYDGTLTITGTTSASFTMPKDADVDDDLILTLTVTDGAGATDTADVTVTAKNASPTARATATGTMDRNTTVTLTGVGDDPDGSSDTVTYEWAKTGGTYTKSISISNNDQASASFTMPSDADDGNTIIVTLTVTDADNATATDTVTVIAGNASPTVNAGSDVNATAGTKVTLSGTANDPDGDNTMIGWQWSGVVTSMLDNGNTSSPTLRLDYQPNDAIGTKYTLTATVTDGDGATATDKVVVTVNNRPPTAEAGSAQTVNQNASVTLSGSGSDPDSDTLSYSWTRPTGAAGGTYTGSVTITNPTSASASFTAPNLTGLTSSTQSKTIILTLTVSDGKGGTATDTVTITVQNAAPTANAGADRNATAGNTASLSVTANDPDGSNSAMTYSWSVNGPTGAPTANLTSTTAATTGLVIPSNAWQASPNYTYTVSVTVTDEDGATATDSAVLTVNNRAPVADARTDKAYALHPQKVNLSGLSSTDPDYDPQTDPVPNWSYSWAKTGGTYTGNITINYATSGSANFTVPNEASIGDTIIITLTLSDGDGGTDTDSVTINVNAAPQESNNPPVADPGAAIQYFSMTTANKDNPIVSLDGSGSSDPDGDTLTYDWSRYGGTCTATITLTNPASAKPTFQWPSSCAISTSVGLRLTVTDRAKNGLSDTEDIQVWRRNGMPTVSIDGGDRTEYKRSDSVARSFTVTADISDDPDGHALTYEWLVRKGETSGTPSGLRLNNDTTKTVSIEIRSAAVPATDYTVYLIVRDSQGSTLTKSASLTIKNNTAPTVKIENQSGTDSKDITGATWWREYRQDLTITDAESHTYTCTWAVSPGGSGGDGGPMAFTDGGTGNCEPKIEVRESATGTHTITVTVTDSLGGTASDTMDIEVQ